MARFGEIKQCLPDKTPQIESASPQIESFQSVKWRFLSVELEKNGHFVTNFGYLRNKDRVLGQKTPQIKK
jgi:hypothetical protein